MKRKLLFIFMCLLTVTSVSADYLTLKVGRSKKLALDSWEYSDKSTDKLMSVWEVDNDKVTLSEMGLSGTSPTCWIKANYAGSATVKCTYQQLIWDISSLRYKQTTLKTKTWYITIVESTTGDEDGGLETIDEEMTIGFVHPDLHLWILADKVSGEATISNSFMDSSDVDGNSIIRPHDENYAIDNTNYWNNLVIPDTIRYAGYTYIITALGPKAFNRALEVETISLPESVTTIGDLAFNWCVRLKSITMSDKVRVIGSSAFRYCRELEYIDLPDSLESLGDGAFADCKELKEITIPEKCRSIGNDAFMWCRKLHKIIIEDDEEPLSLGYNYDLSVEYDADFYKGKPHFRGPFSDSSLDTLYLGRNIELPNPNGLTLSPFGGDGANGFYIIGSDQVECPWHIVLLGFGDNVTKIPDNLLGGKAFANKVTLPPHLEEIGMMAFYKALTQKEMIIPETVTKIGEMAFYNIETMYRFEVGRDNYDLKCWPLRTVYCNSLVPPSTVDSPFGDCTVYVPAGSGTAYREAWGGKIVDAEDEIVTINVRTPGSLYSRLLAQDLQVGDVYRLKLKGSPNDDDWRIVNSMTHLYDWDLSEANITMFPKDFFWDKTNLISLKLPENLTEISDSAFYGCSYFAGNLACPSSCTSIGYHAFQNTAISGLVFSNAINIGKEAFMDCYNFETVKIPSGSTVGEDAFLNSGLKEAVIEDGVKTIESLGCEKIVFEGMVDSIGTMSATEMHAPNILTWLKLPVQSAPHLYLNGEEVTIVTVPDEIRNVKDGAFLGCESLSSVVLPNGIKGIGEDAFNGCTNLQGIKFPSSISYIGERAFAKCSSLTEIALPSKLTTIEPSVFSGCAGINTIFYPSALQTIEHHAFAGCSSLMKAKLPPQLQKIGAWSFSDCSELTEVDIPESVVTIENGAFADCPKINSIVAHWDDPITITDEVFPEVSSDCYLYIPIGTSTKYFNAGWNFLPKLKEAGIMDVTSNKGGNIRYGENVIREETKEYFFTPYKSFTLFFEPDDGYTLKKVYLNGQNITSKIEDGEFFVEEPEENMNIKVVFADNNIATGDANGDGEINVTDAICVVNHILKNTPVVFYDYAADTNNDDVINVTDAISIIRHLIRNYPLHMTHKNSNTLLDPQ